MSGQAFRQCLQHLPGKAATGPVFWGICMALAMTGTLSATYPVTAVVVAATLLAPRRWPLVATATALGSALGATLLVALCHHLGWSQMYQHFPELARNTRWIEVMAWTSRYGLPALFVIALSPLPQTPALIFAGIVRHDDLDVFIVMLAGKLVKYGSYAWVTARFPERFGQGLRGFFTAER
jgi:membrane protein YqaA with SNARE-associated domain